MRVWTLAMLALVACGSDTVMTSANANLAGNYNLVSVNGAALPMVVQSNPRTELVNERLIVNTDGSFTVTTNKQVTNADGTVASQVTTDAGTYTASGASAATFRFSSGNTVSGNLTGNTLTLTAATTTSVYVK